MIKNMALITLRAIIILTATYVLLRMGMLLFPGGTVMLQEATEGVPVTPTVIYQPVFAALIPIVCSLLICVGIINKQLFFLWIGGAAFIIIGVLFMFSLGIDIAIAGLVVVVATFTLSRFS